MDEINLYKNLVYDEYKKLKNYNLLYFKSHYLYNLDYISDYENPNILHNLL